MRSYQQTAFAVHDRRWMMDFASPQRCETCTQPPIQLEPVALSLGVERPGRETLHSLHLEPRSKNE